jgi:replication factor A1
MQCYVFCQIYKVLKQLAVEGFSRNRQPVDAKVGELTPASRAVNVTAKVVSKSEVRNITAGRDGAPHSVCDALVGDETGSVYLTLWDDNIEKVNDGDTITVGNGYVSLFRGNMRLNVGRYGTIEIAKEPLAGEVNTENNLSSKVYEQQRRPFRGRRDFGGRERRGGYRQRRY